MLSIISFIFTCCLAVFFYTKLKERDDELDEFYEIFYKHVEEDNLRNSKTNSKKGVLKYDRNVF